MDLIPEVLQNMRFLELDGLVVIGGDATQSVRAVLASQGVPVWAIPETMDNDIPGTETVSAFRPRSTGRLNISAVSVPPQARTAIPSCFGCSVDNAGFTALETAVVASVDRVLIPEVPADIDRLAEQVAADRHNPHNY